MVTTPALLLVLAMTPPLPVVEGTAATLSTAAAQVLLVSGGDVRVVGKPRDVALQPGMLLRASDRLAMAPDAWVTLLLLHNQAVVRLYDDVVEPIEALALFKAPRVRMAWGSQLLSLLSPGEQEAHAALLARWQVSPPPRSTVSPLPLAGAAPEPDDEYGCLVPEGGGPCERRKRHSRPALAWDPSLRACLATVPRDGGLGPSRLRLELRLDGTLVTLRLPGGLAVPPCAQAWGEAHRTALGAQWTSLDVLVHP